MKNKVQTAYCPECDTTIRFKEAPKLRTKIVCEECDQELEVIGLTPIVLDWAYEDDLDEYDFDDESEDDF